MISVFPAVPAAVCCVNTTEEVVGSVVVRKLYAAAANCVPPMTVARQLPAAVSGKVFDGKVYVMVSVANVSVPASVSVKLKCFASEPLKLATLLVP